MPLQVVELPELETQRRDGVDEGGRPQTCTEVRFHGDALPEKGRWTFCCDDCGFQDLRAGGGGRE